MTWQPKESAPDYFSLADAFISLVTGDSTWGWLIDWATLIPNTGQNTAEFCALGPPTNDPFTADLFNQTPGANALGQSGHIAATVVAVTNAAYERVFAAYCEMPAGVETGWTEIARIAIGSPDSTCTPADGGGNDSGGTHFRWHLHVDTRGSSYTAWSTNQSGTGTYSKGGFPLFELPHENYDEWQSITGGPFNTFCLTVAGGSGSTGYVAVEQLDRATGATDHTVTAQPKPTGVSSPLGSTGADLASIAHELDLQEFKLDNIFRLLQFIVGSTVDLGGPAEDPETVVPEAEIPVGEAVGIIVTSSGIPSELQVGFGTPALVTRLGRLYMGTDSAWYPHVPITHSPFVVRPFPSKVTRCAINGVPPMVSMQTQLILPEK